MEKMEKIAKNAGKILSVALFIFGLILCASESPDKSIDLWLDVVRVMVFVANVPLSNWAFRDEK